VDNNTGKSLNIKNGGIIRLKLRQLKLQPTPKGCCDLLLTKWFNEQF